MSLKRMLPASALPELRTEVEPSSAPPRVVRPQEVVFAKGRDVAELAKEVLAFSNVNVLAHPGAGKSTELPMVLAQVSGKRVYHAMPDRLQAVGLAKYLRSIKRTFTLLLDEGDRPGPGWNLTTYAWVVAEMLRGKYGGSDLQGAIMYADEAHESDAYTYVVSTYGLSVGYSHYIRASASADPDRLPAVHADGDLVTEFYERVMPNKWDPLVPGKPWSVERLTGNTVIFLDDEETVERLTKVYNREGFRVHRMIPGMPDGDFEACLATLADTDRAVAVVFATSAFRGTHTFKGASIGIDSGLYRYWAVEGARRVAKYRQIFEAEKYQTMNRLARCAGEKAVYYYPRLEYQRLVCDLEPLEVEAAALLFRMLGNCPPSALRSAKMAVGNVPIDLPRSLNGFVPLELLSPDAMQPPVIAPVVTPVTDVLNSYGEDSPVPQQHDWFGGMKLDPVVGSVNLTGDGLGLLNDLSGIMAAARTLRYGIYYVAHGVSPDAVCYLYSETNWERAATDVIDTPAIVMGLDNAEREALVAMFLRQYNAHLINVHGIEAVVANATRMTQISAAYPDIATTWAGHYSQELRASHLRCKTALKAVEAVRHAAMSFAPVSQDEEAVKIVAQRVAGAIISAVNDAQSKVDEAVVHEGWRRLISHGSGPSFRELEPVPAAVTGGAGVLRASVAQSTVAGRVVYNYTLHADRALRLTEDDYVSGFHSVLEESGASVDAVGRLVLRGTSVRPERVLQRVKDGNVPVVSDLTTPVEKKTKSVMWI